MMLGPPAPSILAREIEIASCPSCCRHGTLCKPATSSRIDLISSCIQLSATPRPSHSAIQPSILVDTVTDAVLRCLAFNLLLPHHDVEQRSS